MSRTPVCKDCGDNNPANFTVDKYTKTGEVSFRSKCSACFNLARRQRHALGYEGAAANRITPKFDRKVPRASVYVVTWAQNNTRLHKGFWASLQQYATHHGAQIVVIPGVYKNPTSRVEARNMADTVEWAEEVRPHLLSEPLEITPHLHAFCNVPIQPTAVRPLSGLGLFAGGASAVFGHTKLARETVAAGAHKHAKTLHTTGACTIQNYSASKAGRKGEAHHVIGALAIHTDGEGRFWLRVLNADDRTGTFTDLDRVYTPNGVEVAPAPLAIIPGDEHVAKADPEATAAVADLVKRLRPKFRVWHDALDFEARNHHTIRDRDHKYMRHHNPDKYLNSVEEEVRKTCEFIDRESASCIPVVVPSNHDGAFDRWLKTENPFDTDPENALFWAKMMATRYDTWHATGEIVPAFEQAYALFGSRKDIRFLRRGDSFSLKGVELGQHGHEGLNGAKGSPLTFSRMSSKTVTGHNHVPGITDGNYSVGVQARLDQGYNNTALSPWMQTLCLLHASGKRQLVDIIDGMYEPSASASSKTRARPGSRVSTRKSRTKRKG